MHYSFLLPKGLDEIPTGLPPTGAPNAGAVGKKVFRPVESLRLRRLTAENLYSSATLTRVHDGALAEEYAMYQQLVGLIRVGP